MGGDPSPPYRIRKEATVKNKELTYQEFMNLALQNYTKGGMVFYECWEEYQFNDYVQMFGSVTKQGAVKMFESELRAKVVNNW